MFKPVLGTTRDDEICSALLGQRAAAIEAKELHDGHQPETAAPDPFFEAPPPAPPAPQPTFEVENSIQFQAPPRPVVVESDAWSKTAGAASMPMAWKRVKDGQGDTVTRHSAAPSFTDMLAPAVLLRSSAGSSLSSTVSNCPLLQRAGRDYYHNTISGESRWTEPEELHHVDLLKEAAYRSPDDSFHVRDWSGPL